MAFGIYSVNIFRCDIQNEVQRIFLPDRLTRFRFAGESTMSILSIMTDQAKGKNLLLS